MAALVLAVLAACLPAAVAQAPPVAPYLGFTGGAVPAGFVWYPSWWLGAAAGSVLRSAPGTTVAQRAALCAADANCLAFDTGYYLRYAVKPTWAWQNVTTGGTYIKQGVIPGAVAPMQVPGYRFVSMKESLGFNLAGGSALGTPLDNAAACSANPACVGFTAYKAQLKSAIRADSCWADIAPYWNQNDGMYIKDGTTLQNPSAPPSFPGFDYQQNWDSADFNTTRMAGAALSDIAAACAADPNCRAFNTDGWMKSAVYPRSQWTAWGTACDPQNGIFTKSGAVPPDPTGSDLTDCAKSIPYCTTCRYQLWKGTTTKAVCTSCLTGYLPKAAGRACWCSPGYYMSPFGSWCTPCGNNYWCPGAKSTATSADRHACGANKMTTTRYAQSDRECLAMPGFGWAPGDGSTACDIGFYNPGYNNRKCTRCPGSLTTANTGTINLQDCRAGAGYYYISGKAVACAQGFYKTTIGNFDCTECPDGFTTAPGTVAATLPSNCAYVEPGYAAPATATIGVTAATPCPPDTYRSDYTLLDGTADVVCTPCPSGLRTMANVTGATSIDQCLAPPGWGYNIDTGNATICPQGAFNLGWNKEACTPCGAGGMMTDAPGATSADACYTPAGWGNTRGPDGTLTAAICPLNTYGVPNNTYGLVDVACTKCLTNTATNRTGSTAPSDCLTNPGYGYYSGSVLMCEYGTYSPGYHQAPCTACGEGFNTTSDPTTLPNALAVRGASANESCAVDFGWTYVVPGEPRKGIKPCVQGYYKDLLGSASCSQCPNATTTTIILAATQRTDCNACRPGFGSAAIDLQRPNCDLCPSGTWSPGMIANGAPCIACPKLELFTGKMVSRRGTSTPEDCLGEFTTDPGSMENGLGWDFIPFAPSALTAVNGSDDEASCQAACAGNPACQYFEFRMYRPYGSRCRLKLGPGPIRRVDITPTGNYILFEVKTRAFAVYEANGPADADATGNTVASGFSTLDEARASCDAADACIGLSYSAASQKWRTFGGDLIDFTVGKVRAVGEAINTWVAEPSGAPFIS